MKSIVATLVFISTAALADTVSGGTLPPTKPVCTPPDELTVKLSFARAVVLNNILQDVDVGHREWTDVAADVRSQLVGQCKETKK